MTEFDAQNARTKTIVGDGEDQSFEQAIERFYQHLTESLQLPCDVTGIEDFDWEEYYVLGPGDYAEYNKLRKTQPSYQDIFELLAIEKETGSEWMMFLGEDLAARVQRKSDGVAFHLGLAEIETVERGSLNHQLLYDYAVWFVNNR